MARRLFHKMVTDEAYRKLVVNELVVTERVYIDDLHVLIKV